MRTRKLTCTGGFLALAVILGGCAHPAKIATNLELSGRPPDLAVVTLKIKNEDSSATTPLLVDVAVQFRHGDQWSAPVSVIHPSGFVLKKQEEQILRATLKRKGEAIRATVSVKEQETGKVVGSKKVERSANDLPGRHAMLGAQPSYGTEVRSLWLAKHRRVPVTSIARLLELNGQHVHQITNAISDLALLLQSASRRIVESNFQDLNRSFRKPVFA